MGAKRTVRRDPDAYGNDRRRARQYWAKRSKLLGAGYMLPTAAESEEWNTKVVRAGKAAGVNLSMDAGRIRPKDKDAPDILVWGEDALLASEVCETKGKWLDAPKDAPTLQALSLECRSDEFLDRYFRSPDSD